MRQTVLLVEDHRDTRDVYALSLCVHGYHVVEAADGWEALARLADEPPDIVVTDLAMPGVSGVELCRRIRATPNGGGLPILAVTGQSNEQTQREVEAAGACALCEKPLSPDDLVHAVETLLAVSPRCSRCWETHVSFRWVQIGGVRGLMRHEPLDPAD